VKKSEGGERMNKKVLVIVVALMAVAMLALPISVVSATKPTTMTLSGTIYILGEGTGKIFVAGESGNNLLKFRDVPVLWTGDIAGSGVYNANWLDKVSGDMVVDVAVGTHVLEDAMVDGIGVGDLSIGHNKDGFEYFIKSGTGYLSSIRGKGTLTMVNPVTYDYELEVQINP
jgi:hypothetical protein